MISKRIFCDPANDSYKRLANYIADASHQGEKSLVSWCAGCWAGDDYELATQEVLDTQALNTRTAKEKTYHLVISFHPEDESRLTADDFKAVEARFAQVLGLSEHQRHCGVHINTENMHMHIAYNLIHPETLTRVEPWRDYFKRDKLCRELELEYGLTIDNGRDPGKERGLGDKAAIVESHTGMQSFEGYAREQGSAIVEMLTDAQTWEDVHRAFAVHGMELKPRNAGLVAKDRTSRKTAKASVVDRGLSLKKLEARFGAYQPVRQPMPESAHQYALVPLHKAPDRNSLWKEFQEQRQTITGGIEGIRDKWEQHREELRQKPIARKTRANLMKLTRQYEAEEVLNARTHGSTNWLDFLRQKAAAGDEAALAVLRSRGDERAPEQHTQHTMQNQAAYLAEKTAILENSALSPRSKQHLSSVALMKRLAPDVEFKISNHGHIIYTLPSGGKVCDTGKRISFSDNAKETALAYMSEKWNVKRREIDRETGKIVYRLNNGQSLGEIDQNTFERPTMSRQHARGRGL